MVTTHASLALALGILGSIAVYGYGCSSKSTPAAIAPTDAGDDAEDSSPAPRDAGADIEQNPDIYPAAHAPIPLLNFLGGPVLANPKVVTVTFNYDTIPTGDSGTIMVDPFADGVAAFDDYITTSNWWTTVMAGFNVSAGSGGGHIALPDTVSNTSIQDSDVQAFIQAEVAAGVLPPGDDQTIYAMYYPPRTTISLEGGVSCSDFLGYHDSVTVVDATGNNVNAAYAVLPRCSAGGSGDFDELTITASHEFAEAASDPQPTGNRAYYLTTNDAWIPAVGISFAGGECGDLCLFAPNYPEGKYAVQSIWSNAAAMASKNPCQPSTANYYGAAVRTTAVEGDFSSKSLGYIPVVRGKSVDAIIDFFSDAPLDHDVTLYTGTPTFTLGDPTALDPIPDGITATLSQTTAQNGAGIVMTVTVPPKAVPGNYSFVVRSVYEAKDFNDWPVIVRVTSK